MTNRKMRVIIPLLIILLGIFCFNVIAFASGGEGGGEAMTNHDIATLASRVGDNEQGGAIVTAALNYVGTPYSQTLRGAGYMDCSSFVERSMADAGISIPGTSVEQAVYCLENDLAIREDDVQAGDLVFWTKTSCNCGRTHEIHHVGIYLGEGKIAEASSSKGAVVVRNIWESDTWKIAFFARVL